MPDLLREFNYAEVADGVSEQDLRNELYKYPERIDDWLQYSEDKRCIGWYFLPKGPNKYVVGFLGKNNDKEYGDVAEACSAYIMKELEGLRGFL